MSWEVRGKTALVTGATSGIGLHASIDLARLGARVVMAGRDPRRADAALAEVRARSGSNDVSLLLCDFSSQAAVRALADEYRRRHDRLDVLINNAGRVYKTRTFTADGIEATFAVNHLGAFLLTNLLLDLVRQSAPARIVTVSSIAHRDIPTIDFEDFDYDRGYWIMRAYARSKLANVLFSNELARRLEGTGITSNSMHPGTVDTRIWSGAPSWAKPFLQVGRLFFIGADKGGRYLSDLATRPDLSGVTGRYFEKDKIVEPTASASDAELAARLWEMSAAMVHLDIAAGTPPATRA